MAILDGAMIRALGSIERTLYPYLLRYTSLSIRDLDAEPIDSLRRYADGVSKILEAENGK